MSNSLTTTAKNGNPKDAIMKPQVPLKWHGGKTYLASRIIGLMPSHTHYVEPFFGGGAVLLAKDPEGVSEVVNDLNYDLTNFWCSLQSEESFEELKRRLDPTPFSEVEWEGSEIDSKNSSGGKTGRAAAFFIRCRMSMSGRMKDFAPLSRTRTRRGMNEQASAWMNCVDGLPEIHARLRRVVILNRPAVEVIKQQDGPQTLFYCDPPYLPETRASSGEYAHEMTSADHVELLNCLKTVKGRVIISGYPSHLYEEALHDWTRVDFDLPNNAAGGKSKRRMTECVWCNFSPVLEATR